MTYQTDSWSTKDPLQQLSVRKPIILPSWRFSRDDKNSNDRLARRVIDSFGFKKSSPYCKDDAA